MQELGKISPTKYTYPTAKVPVGTKIAAQQGSVSLSNFYNVAAIPPKISRAQYAEIILENLEKAALDGKKISFTKDIEKQVQEGLDEIKAKAFSLGEDREKELYVLKDKYYHIKQRVLLLQEISRFQNELNIPNPENSFNLNSLHDKLLEQAKISAFLNSALYQDLKKAAGDQSIEALINSAQEHKIGQGGKRSVYEIPNTEYVLRAQNGAKLNISPNAIFKYEYDFSKKAKANHVIASIEDGRTEYEILERLSGIKKNIQNAQNPNYARIIANMPQGAYDDYLKQIKSAASAGLVQDFGGENMFIDIEQGCFLPFDYETLWINETTHFTRPDIIGEAQVEPITNMAYTLLNLGEAHDIDVQRIKGKILKAVAGNIDEPEKNFFDFDDKFYKDFAPKEILDALQRIQDLKLHGDWNNYRDALSVFYKKVDDLFIGKTQDLSKESLIELTKEMKSN